MNKILPPLIIGLCINANAQPINNPVLDHFADDQTVEHFGYTFGDYSWTDSLDWSNVTVTSANGTDLPPNAPNATEADISGSTADDLATIQAEIDSIALQGGGVLYFPAGTYFLSDTLHLKSGVILRGAAPAQSDARELDYDPPTNFVFPRLPGIVEDPDVPGSGQRLDPATAMTFTNLGDTVNVMKAITLEQSQALTASNYGIVNIDLNRARIDFLKVEKEDGTVDASSILAGTNEKNRVQVENVVVFGNRLNNTIQLDYNVPASDSDYNSWQVWTNRIKSSIDVMAKENLMIANNRINDNAWNRYVNGGSAAQYPIDDFWMPTTGPNFTDAEVYLRNNGSRMTNAGEAGLINSQNKYIRFNYARGIGITANRSSRVGWSSQTGGAGPSSPAGEPSLYRKGVIVRQNWVFTNERGGISVSGTGVEVRDNVRVDIPNQVVWIRSDGKRQQTVSSTTFENRGIDFTGGMNTLIDNNDIEVFRRTMPLSSDAATKDGEAILVQPQDSGVLYNQTITNNRTNAYIAVRNMQWNRNLNISNNVVESAPTGIQADLDILLLADPNFFPGIMRNLTIENNRVDRNIEMTSSLVDLSAPHVFRNNAVGGQIFVPDYTNSFLDPSTLVNDIVYEDLSGNTDLQGNPINVSLVNWATETTGSFQGDFALSNVIDSAPVVEILHPAPDTPLLVDVPIMVEVRVTVNEEDPRFSNTLDSVTLYDASQLTPNQLVFRNEHRSDPNALAGSVVLSPKAGETIGTNGSGVYTAEWTPTQEYLDYGLFVIDAVMSEVTAQDGVQNQQSGGEFGSLQDFLYRDSTFAILGLDGASITPVGSVELMGISSIGDTLSITIADGGLTYSVSSAADFSTAPSTWPTLSNGVTIGEPSNGEITIDIDISSTGESSFFIIGGE